MIGCHEVLCNCYHDATMTDDIWKKKIVDKCLWGVSIRAEHPGNWPSVRTMSGRNMMKYLHLIILL